MLRNSSQILCRDTASRLTAMLASNGDRVNFIFDAGGRLRESSIPDGLKAQYSYDAGDNLRKRINRTSQGIVSQHDYTHNATRIRRQSTAPSPTTAMTTTAWTASSTSGGMAAPRWSSTTVTISSTTGAYANRLAGRLISTSTTMRIS